MADYDEKNLDVEIQRLMQIKRQQRRYEQGLKAREIALSTQEQIGSSSVRNLKKELNDTLPSYMVPTNVGGIDSVQWPFLFAVNFDLSTTPGWPAFTFSTSQTRFFQVTQESGFLLMSIVKVSSQTAAGALAPLQLEIIDRQSSRRFTNNPMPLQTIGDTGLPTVFPTPMLVMPNASIELTLSSQMNNGQNYAGASLHQITFFGYRTRIDNAENVLSTIFG